MKTNPQLPASICFQLQQLADGVYADFNILGNAGIVDLGDRTLMHLLYQWRLAEREKMVV
jgi:hypothetical protein